MYELVVENGLCSKLPEMVMKCVMVSDSVDVVDVGFDDKRRHRFFAGWMLDSSAFRYSSLSSIPTFMIARSEFSHFCDLCLFSSARASRNKLLCGVSIFAK